MFEVYPMGEMSLMHYVMVGIVLLSNGILVTAIVAGAICAVRKLGKPANDRPPDHPPPAP